MRKSRPTAASSGTATPSRRGTPSDPIYKEVVFNTVLVNDLPVMGDPMVPAQVDHIYGNLKTRAAFAGQNKSMAPENSFERHFLVGVILTIIGGAPLYVPSWCDLQ